MKPTTYFRLNNQEAAKVNGILKALEDTPAGLPEEHEFPEAADAMNPAAWPERLREAAGARNMNILRVMNALNHAQFQITKKRHVRAVGDLPESDAQMRGTFTQCCRVLRHAVKHWPQLPRGREIQAAADELFTLATHE